MVTARAVDDGLVQTKPRAKLPVIKRPTKKKPKDKPKRPLSSYNFFFKEERELIVKVVLAEDPSAVKQDPEDDGFLDVDTIGRLKKEGKKVSFEEMGKIIGQRWKNIDPDRLAKYAELASKDTERYKTEMQEYNGRQEAKMRNEALKRPVSYAAASTGPAIPVDRGATYADVRGGYGEISGGAAYTGMSLNGIDPNGMSSSGIGPATMGTTGVGNAHGYGYDFPGYSNMGMNAYGNGMHMAYGGYPQSMEPSNTYGGGPYGSMGTMGVNGFQSGMTGYPDQSYSGQQMDPQHPGAHMGGGYNANNSFSGGGGPQGSGAGGPQGNGLDGPQGSGTGGSQGKWGQG